MIVYAVVDTRSRRRSPSATRSRPMSGEDAERFIEEVRGDEPELAKELRIEGRELNAGGRNPSYLDDPSDRRPSCRSRAAAILPGKRGAGQHDCLV
jgi:hypothetical protein